MPRVHIRLRRVSARHAIEGWVWLLALALAAAISAPAQPTGGGDKIRQRFEWLYNQRAYPRTDIPDGAYVSAARAMSLLEAEADDARKKDALRRGVAATNAQWTLIGPKPTNYYSQVYSGRVQSLAIDPRDDNVVYIGGAWGGIWKTTDGGVNWTPLTDFQPSLSVGAIAIDPSNPNTVYAASGDFYRSAGSDGLLKSTDAGATWTYIPAPTLYTGHGVGVKALVVYQLDSRILVANVSGGGVYRSADSGVTWTRVLSGSPGFNITNFQTHGAYMFTSVDNRVMRSPADGLNWVSASGTGANALPSSGQVEFAVAPSNTAVLYANSRSGSGLTGFYKSTDGGNNWTSTAVPGGQLSTFCGTQCWYDNLMRVHPTNPNHVLAGGLWMYRSLDGAQSWDEQNGNNHVDNHSIEFTASGSKVYSGNDGGIYSTSNPAASTVSWTSLNSTLALTQFYPGMVLLAADVNTAYAGSQDNGTQKYSGSLAWTEVPACGDGGWSAIDFNTPSTVYTACQNINVQKTTNVAGNNWNQVITGIDTSDSSIFIPPLVMDPSNSSRLYFGTTKVYQTNNGAAQWAAVSPDFGSRVTSIAAAPSDPNTVYAGFSNGAIQATSNALSGAAWSPRSTGLPARYVTQVVVDPSNALIAYVTVSGFGTGHVFRTANGGVSWTDISGNLPDVPANDLVVDPDQANTLYVGTDVGVLRTVNGGSTWAPPAVALPRTQVMSLKLHRATRTLRAATYGRSAWDLLVPAGPPCVTIAPGSRSHGSEGETGSISVSGAGSCSWTAFSDSSWISVTGGASGTGAGTVSYSVAANTAAPRTGTIIIGGVNFTVTQAARPRAISVTPSSGSGASQTFSFVVSDTTAYTNLTLVEMNFNATPGIANACVVHYDPPSNSLILRNDANDGWLGPLVLGSSGILQNSQCVVSGGGSSASGSGTDLTVNLAMSFKPGFAGDKNVYLQTLNSVIGTGWQPVGTWTVTTAAGMISVTPASGSGTTQVFTIRTSSAYRLSVEFNTSPGAPGGCVLTIYSLDQPSASLYLGSLFGGYIPGGGTAQSSSCLVNTFESSKSASGADVAITFSVSFKGSFAGVKNIYLSGSGFGGSTSAQLRGTWTAVAGPLALLVSPGSGTGASQTFSFLASDPVAYTNLTLLEMNFNATPGIANACVVHYDRASNALTLRNDGNNGWIGPLTVGAAGILQNSQCSVNGPGSSASGAGTDLTVNLAMSFRPGFAGAKNVYMQALNQTQTTSWQNFGYWTANQAPAMISATPGTGSGATQAFTFAASNVSSLYVEFNTAVGAAGGCTVNVYQLDTASPYIYLGNSFAGYLGGTGAAQNSSCLLSVATSSQTVSGPDRTVTFTVTFKNAFAGTKNIYMSGYLSSSNSSTAAQLRGAFTVVAGLIAASVTPDSGSGSVQTFTFVASDPAGYANMTLVEMNFNTSAAVGNACVVHYDRASNALTLRNDANTGWFGPVTAGAAGVLENSQCIVSGPASSASGAGTDLTVKLGMIFKSAYQGTKNVYLQALNSSTGTGWQPVGSWTATPVFAPVSITPGAGSGAAQSFSFRVTNFSYYNDLYVDFNTVSGQNTGCKLDVWFTPSRTYAYLIDDNGSYLLAGAVGGTGIAQTSRCILNIAGSSATVAGGEATVTVALAFKPAFAGAKDVFISNGYGGPWPRGGSWTAAAGLLAASVSPASGTGASQTFTFLASDSSYQNLTAMEMNFNASAATSNACVVHYGRAASTLILRNDADTAWLGPLAVGGDGILQNSQCVISGAGSSAAGSGTDLTLNLALSFKAAFLGAKKVYLHAQNGSGGTGFQQVGAWTVDTSAAMVAVSPGTGSGASQVFTFSVSNGNSSNFFFVDFNTSPGAPNGCQFFVITSGTNGLYFYSDGGVASFVANLGQAGTGQNSQCSVSTAGASISQTGGDQTIVIPVTFKPAYAGTKNIYMHASTPDWQLRGRWTPGSVVTADSVTPSTGSGSSATLAAVYSASSGYADLHSTYLLINSSFTGAGACSLQYQRDVNGFYLLANDGTTWQGPLTAGSSGSLQNSQCILNGTGSSVSGSGNSLTMTVALAFKSSFAGAKTVYTYGLGNGGFGSPWQNRGAFTVTASAPTADSVSPASGSGTGATFAGVFSAADGYAAVHSAYLLINTAVSGTGACFTQYSRDANAFYLLSDNGAWQGPLTAGSSGSLQNNQCTLNGTGTSAAGSGNTLTMTVSLAFKPAFAGAKTVYLFGLANSGLNTGWQARGAFTATGPGITADSVTPPSGSGSSASLAAVFTSGLGYTDVHSAYLLLNTSVSGAGSCFVQYQRAADAFYLLSDGGAWQGPLTAGSASTLQNNQCTLNGTGTSASGSGNTLTVTVSLAFKGAFNGAKAVFLYGLTNGGLSSGWQYRGSITVAAPHLTPVSVTPASGSGASAVFTAVLSDSNGYADMVSADFLISSAVSSVGACFVNYQRASDTFYLLNDGGTGFQGPLAAGSSGTLQNSQCVLNGAGSTAAGSGNTLTLILSLSFKAPFAGAKTVYLAGTANIAPATGFLPKGTFTVSTPVITADSVTPASGSGTSATLAAVFSDGNGYADVHSAYLLMNGAFSGAGACFVQYQRDTAAFYLLGNAGSWLGPLTAGSSNSLGNNQCTLNGTGTSVSGSGNTLTVTVALEFKAPFAGAKTVFLYGLASSGLNSGWQSRGTYTVSTPSITADSAAASSSSGPTASLVAAFSAGNGYADVHSAYLLVNGTFSGSGACYVQYQRDTNGFYLLGNGGTWQGPLTAGSSSTLQNSQCTLNGVGTSVTGSGNTLTVTVSLAFSSGFAGTKTMFLYGLASSGANSGWQARGSFTVTAPSGPTADSVTPSSGSGASATLAAVYSVPGGYGNYHSVYLLMNTGVSAAQSCFVQYQQGANAFYLLSDAGAWQGPLVAGAASSLQNNQCTLSGTGTSISGSGNSLTINVALTFKAAFAGAKTVFLYGLASTGSATGWQSKGAWTAP